MTCTRLGEHLAVRTADGYHVQEREFESDIHWIEYNHPQKGEATRSDDETEEGLNGVHNELGEEAATAIQQEANLVALLQATVDRLCQAMESVAGAVP
jgi:hypothetical protein